MASIRAEDIPRLAEELLRRHGLEMPDVRIQVMAEGSEEAEEAKSDFLGRFFPGEKRIELTPDSNPITVMHEIGHAWAEENLTKIDKARIARAIGLPVWDSHDVIWPKRATERAADVFSFKVLEGSGLVDFADIPRNEKHWKILTAPMRNRRKVQQQFQERSNRVGQAQVNRRVALE